MRFSKRGAERVEVCGREDIAEAEAEAEGGAGNDEAKL